MPGVLAFLQQFHEAQQAAPLFYGSKEDVAAALRLFFADHTTVVAEYVIVQLADVLYGASGAFICKVVTA